MGLHPGGQHCHHFRLLLSYIIILIRIFYQVVKLYLRFEVEIRLQGTDQLPFRSSPAMFPHPGALRNVELRLPFPPFTFHKWNQAVSVKFTFIFNAHDFQDGRHYVLVLAVVSMSLTCRNLARIAENEGDGQCAVIQTVVIIPAFMIVKGFSMVRGDDNQGFLFNTHLFHYGKDILDAGVHIGYSTVILGNDIIFVGHTRREPLSEIVYKGLLKLYTGSNDLFSGSNSFPA